MSKRMRAGGFEDDYGTWHNCPDWCPICGSCDGPAGTCERHADKWDLFGEAMMRELAKMRAENMYKQEVSA